MIRTRITWLRRTASRRRTASPSAIRARRRTALVALGRSGLVAAAVVGIVGFLVLLLGPAADWATVGADSLQGKEKTDAVNTTRQILLAAAVEKCVIAHRDRPWRRGRYRCVRRCSSWRAAVGCSRSASRGRQAGTTSACPARWAR